MEAVVEGLALGDEGHRWRGKRVLVTGATGIVGGWVSQALLASGAHLVALVQDVDARSVFYRSHLDRLAAVVNGSLEDLWALERAINNHEVDTVIHLGAQTIVGTAERFPLPTFEANIRGTYNLLEVCRLHSNQVRRVVVASSDKAYGDHAGAAYTEDGPLEASHPYDVSKACGDMIARAYAVTYGLPVAIARCGNIYGGGDLNWSRIVPGTIRSLLGNERPVVRSDGTFIRDYLYVKDAAAGYLALAEHVERADVRGRAFNFSGHSPRKVLDVVSQIAALLDKQDMEPIIMNTARHEIPQQVISSGRVKDVLGWEPKYSLEEGLAETIAWYRSFLDSTGSAAEGAA